MEGIDNKLLDFLVKENLSEDLFKGNFGIEKENVRVYKDGHLALTAHPAEFGDKLENAFIKTDFSESQVEVVTPACKSLEEMYDFLENLQNIVSSTLKDEYLWPQSNPPILPSDGEIPIACYGEAGKVEREYREKLAEKYGRKKQLLSGIHFNFSFDEDFLRHLYREFSSSKDFKDFKSSIYLRTVKNFLKYRWFLIYLTGASPVFHKSYMDSCVEISESLEDETSYSENLVSLRNGICGYKNKEDFPINYDSLSGYIESIKELIHCNKIENASELYSPIRVKSIGGKNSLEILKSDGIKYVEVRILDLNPLSKNGIFLEDLYLINTFLIYMLLKEDSQFNEKEQEISNINHNIVATLGRKSDLTILNSESEKVLLKDEALKIIYDMEHLVRKLGIKEEFLLNIVANAKEKILDSKQTYSYKVLQGIKEKSYVDFHIDKAKEYLEETQKKNFNLIGYEDLELSTQILIKDSIKRGIEFKVIDRKENFISLSFNGKTEYVKQATKTSKDSYSTVLVMENKVVTKEVLKENEVRIPSGENYNSIEEAMKFYDKFENKKIVIKPKSTNFGIGISIFKDGFNKDDFRRALEIAFDNDNTVLVEEFIEGKEYRFLVIDDEVVGILHRVPANVCGNGVNNISELVKEKNKDSLRGKGYKTPLEKISLGEIEEMFLKAQGKHFTYVPNKDEIVYLRENSNVSTGGDSIDYTDKIDESYKEMAIKAAKAVGASICGVDMMITNINEKISKDNYGIIELNFNPAIHIHCYPYKGKNRNVGEKVLNLLFRG
ncbi:bifunctional glutamate--cysteine ligase GshA/glutathione synthetase GshB [Clostridium intestinale]|uniref:bifunctional glutamate--cysteine ligase GshA/glutathione synthetase GshB n=1 Tax=Clostridium intestinale TaxID=36845 RepID=UPI002DD67ED1|nr:bifunctional glutamate--cysteine ligase GshA/glutathione synthetase GshB [Clostridium intestinale]WRY50813.1 bifunctional glutamate--cysteine ligase GshA/glutathione synthetase GshB [Clostridium intestinale]